MGQDGGVLLVGLRWMGQPRRVILAVLALLTGAVMLWASAPWPDVLDFELAGSGRRAVEVLGKLPRVELAREGLRRDDKLVAAYAALAVAALVLVRPRSVRKERQLRAAAWIAAVLAPLADIVENIYSRRLVDRFAELRPKLPVPDPLQLSASKAKKSILDTANLGREVDDLAHRVLAYSLIKWVFLAVLVVWAVSLLRQPLRSPHRGGRPDLRVPPPRTRDRTRAPGDDPDRWRPAPGRIGISCSGGGVRSATFSLGALQCLDDHGVLGDAAYVTAVSGGSYLAAAAAISEWTGTWQEGSAQGIRSDPDADLPTFGRGSPEESWFRRNSSYLASDASEVSAGVARTLLGLIFNLVLLWLVIFAVARPLGWVTSSALAHPELRAREPSVRVTAQPRLGTASDEAVMVTSVTPTGSEEWEFDFVVEPRHPARVQVWRPTLGVSSERETRKIPLVVDRVGVDPVGVRRVGVGRVDHGTVTILRQPKLVADPKVQIPPETNADPQRATVVVTRQPKVVVDGGVATRPEAGLRERIDSVLRVDDRPQIRQYSGTTGRPRVSFQARDWLWGLVPLGLAVAVYLAKILSRCVRGGLNGSFNVLLALTGVVGVATALLYLVLPWSVQEVPPRLARLAGHVPGISRLPAGGDNDAGSVLTVLLGVLGLSASSLIMAATKQFRRRPLLALKAASVVVLVGLGYVTLVSLVQMAAANGPTGRLTGWGLGSTVRWLPDYTKWLAVLAALVVLAVVADAHSWSIFPYYKRRLSHAFVLYRPESGRVAPLPYEVPVHFFREGVPADVNPAARIRPAATGGGGWRGPELVLCAAANTVDEGVAASGRRAVTFTFSASEIGGPEIGYVPTRVFLRRMALRRLRDLTIPAAVAMSGAAISPAIGKAGLGPVGRLLAVLNVRLGVWLPSPCWVAEMKDGETWLGRPGWTYFAREVLGQFRVDHRYLYVSDGGHWENLGLVELFRRGCTRIYCISAAGDGAASFGTLGEALALAREELGLDIKIELEWLRPSIKPPEPATEPPEPATELPEPATEVDGTPVRELRRSGGRAAMAHRPYAVGTFTYPPDPGDPEAEPVEGKLFVVEANIPENLPWDVHAHAERWPLFPDDSTADQLFGHRQFESYRQLGYSQFEALFDNEPDAGV